MPRRRKTLKGSWDKVQHGIPLFLDTRILLKRSSVSVYIMTSRGILCAENQRNPFSSFDRTPAYETDRHAAIVYTALCIYASLGKKILYQQMAAVILGRKASKQQNPNFEITSRED